ncbi:nose resistant to fluoxetine protein 6-like [Glandiceps talaboti]
MSPNMASYTCTPWTIVPILSYSLLIFISLKDIYVCQAIPEDELTMSANKTLRFPGVLIDVVPQIPDAVRVVGVVPQITIDGARNCSDLSGCYLSNRCYNHTVITIEDYRGQKEYAQKMFYAFGEILLEGKFTKNYKFLGNFGICRDASPSSEGLPFSSQYCLATMTSHSEKRLELGVCFPNTCSDREVSMIMTQVTTGANITSGKCNVHCTKDIPFSVGARCAILVDTRCRKGTITCLHGIRVISCVWIILGHTYQITGRYSPDNPNYILHVVLKRASAQIYLNGYLAVDTFFVIGGMLVTYLTLKHLNQSNGKVNWLLFLFHRYWRLTPVYMFVLLIWSTLIIHMGTGPRWHYLENRMEPCYYYWWMNLLYVNNFLHFTNQCMPWAWYLALDMQFHLVTPIFIILLNRRWKWGIGVLLGVCVLSFITTITISTIIGHSPDLTSTPYTEESIDSPFGGWLYDKPYYRIQAYIVGIFLGFIFYRMEGTQIQIKQTINVLLWCLSITIGLAVVLGLHPTSDGDLFPQWVSVLYITFSKVAYGAAVSWVIFACHIKYGGVVNSLLSWKVWIPLSRLTYCAYLIHPVIVRYHNGRREVLFHYTDESMVYFYIAVVFLSYLLAMVLAIGVEFPLTQLEKTILQRVKKTNQSANGPDIVYL